MKTYIIFIEDRDEAENSIFSVEAESIEDAKEIFVKRFVPYIAFIGWVSLVDILQNIDIYIHIICADKLIKLN